MPYANPEDKVARDKRYYQQNRERRIDWQKAYALEHKDEIAVYQKAYRSEHKDEYYSTPTLSYKDARRHYLKSAYRLTLEQFEALLASQDHKCAICREEFYVKFPYVDHDHNTGAVRGLLCNRCNLAIAIFDKPLLLESAAKYLSLTINRES